MKNLKDIKLCVFDAYGTLFDINSVTKHYCKELGDISEQFSSLWRLKQLEYSWLRSLMNRYDDFWRITEESLDYALDYFNIKNDLLKTNLLKAYENINCYEEVPAALSKLKERGISTAILSNATPNMLYMAIKNSKINSLINSCLSVDNLKIYKPHPSVYNLILEKYDLNKNEILFVSSNSWDVAGAKSFGFNVSWINRYNFYF
ncbi:MAG: haloacid dehalogenase type II [Clostridium sp.]